MIERESEKKPVSPVPYSRHVVLQMGLLSLLIPQHQVLLLEPAFDVQHRQEEKRDWLTVAGVRSPVYCLSEKLQPLPEVPADRHICVLLDSGDEKFGLVCNQVFLFEPGDLDIRPLPACMYMPNTPLRGLVLHEAKVLCVASAHDVLACIALEAASDNVGKPAIEFQRSLV
jgi:hypothetical protein